MIMRKVKKNLSRRDKQRIAGRNPQKARDDERSMTRIRSTFEVWKKAESRRTTREMASG